MYDSMMPSEKLSKTICRELHFRVPTYRDARRGGRLRCAVHALQELRERCGPDQQPQLWQRDDSGYPTMRWIGEAGGICLQALSEQSAEALVRSAHMLRLELCDIVGHQRVHYQNAKMVVGTAPVLWSVPYWTRDLRPTCQYDEWYSIFDDDPADARTRVGRVIDASIHRQAQVLGIKLPDNLAIHVENSWEPNPEEVDSEGLQLSRVPFRCRARLIGRWSAGYGTELGLGTIVPRGWIPPVDLGAMPDESEVAQAEGGERDASP